MWREEAFRGRTGRNQLGEAGVGALCEEEGVENVPDFCIKEAGVACTQRGRQRSGGKGQGEGKTRWYNFLRN